MEKLKELLKEHVGTLARMISMSKSFYHEMNPDSVVVFNGNIITKEDNKVWFGDLDLTKDEEALVKCAKLSGETFYVLSEMDGRFGAENQPFKILKKKSIAEVSPKGLVLNLPR